MKEDDIFIIIGALFIGILIGLFIFMVMIQTGLNEKKELNDNLRGELRSCEFHLSAAEAIVIDNYNLHNEIRECNNTISELTDYERSFKDCEVRFFALWKACNNSTVIIE